MSDVENGPAPVSVTMVGLGLSIDYALLPRNIETAAKRSRSLGFVPCVTRVPLDQLP